MIYDYRENRFKKNQYERKTMTKNIGIISLGHFVPHRVLTNHDLEKMVDTSDEWIMTRTGIKERRIAGRGEKNSHLATHAAREALKKAGMDPLKLELIVVERNVKFRR